MIISDLSNKLLLSHHNDVDDDDDAVNEVDHNIPESPRTMVPIQTRRRTNFFTPSLASRCSSLPFLSSFNMLLSSCIHFLQDIFLLGILKPPIAKRCCINEFPMMTDNFFPFTFTKTLLPSSYCMYDITQDFRRRHI